MQNIYWMEHTYPKWSILPLLPQPGTAGAVTLKHPNLHVNLQWKDDGSQPQSLWPLGMFILHLNQCIQVGIVHKAPEPWVQMAVASGRGRIWQSWAFAGCAEYGAAAGCSVGGTSSLQQSCAHPGLQLGMLWEPDMVSMMGLTAGLSSATPQGWSAGLASVLPCLRGWALCAQMCWDTGFCKTPAHKHQATHHWLILG